MPRRPRPAPTRPAPPTPAPAGPAGASGVRPPRQARGQATQADLLQACERLLRRRPFGDITVRDIVAEAGCSIGAFYSRFAGKEALLVPLVTELFEGATREVDAATRPAPTLFAQLHRYTETMVNWFSVHRRGLMSAAWAARGATAREIGVLFERFNRHAHRSLRAALAPHARALPADAHPSAIEFGLFFASAAARDGVDPRAWQTYEVSPDPAALTEAITAAWFAFLTSPATTKPKRRRR